MLNLKSAEEVRKAFTEISGNVKKSMPEAKIVGQIVQEMAPPSTEVIIGAAKDQQFGQTVMFGLGGIFVEILKDVTFRIAPITEKEARKMIAEIKADPILKGYRSQPPADIEALVKILINVSRLTIDHPEIKEIDLNPVIVYENGAKVVDARIILDENLFIQN